MEGDRIRALLRERGITQRKLAELTEYSENYISKILSDAPSHPYTDLAAIRIAKALDVDPWDIKSDFTTFTDDEWELVRAYRRVPRPGRETALQIAMSAFDTLLRRFRDDAA